MATTTAKVKKRNPLMIWIIVLMFLVVGVICVQLFWPQTLDSETGKLTRIGGSKKKSLNPASSTKMAPPTQANSNSQDLDTVSDSDNPLTTEVIE
jgi:flagellar basal body-associated protein FliL